MSERIQRLREVAPWRFCPECGDYHFTLRPGVSVECRMCGHRWRLICPKCGSHVARVESRKDATGRQFRRAVCQCGNADPHWNVSFKGKRWHHRIYADRGPCAVCGGAGENLDHIVPLGRGGKDIAVNLQWLCGICHAEKTARDFPRWSQA